MELQSVNLAHHIPAAPHLRCWICGVGSVYCQPTAQTSFRIDVESRLLGLLHLPLALWFLPFRDGPH